MKKSLILFITLTFAFAGVAVAVVFPAVVLAFQVLMDMSARFVGERAEPVRADIQERAITLRCMPENQRTIEQFQRQEVTFLG